MLFDDESDKLFTKIARSLDLDNILEEFAKMDSASGPIYYGCTITIGPDGKPTIQEHGNLKPNDLPSSSQKREFLVDTIVDEKNNAIKLVAEMPGVEKNDIKVVVEGKSIDISAEHGDKKYHNTISIKDNVDEDSGKASYTNGILEVSFKRIKTEPTGKTLEVN